MVISCTLQLRITLWDLLSWKNYSGQSGMCLMLCEQEVLDASKTLWVGSGSWGAQGHSPAPNTNPWCSHPAAFAGAAPVTLNPPGWGKAAAPLGEKSPCRDGGRSPLLGHTAPSSGKWSRGLSHGSCGITWVPWWWEVLMVSQAQQALYSQCHLPWVSPPLGATVAGGAHGVPGSAFPVSPLSLSPGTGLTFTTATNWNSSQWSQEVSSSLPELTGLVFHPSQFKQEQKS